MKTLTELTNYKLCFELKLHLCGIVRFKLLHKILTIVISFDFQVV